MPSEHKSGVRRWTVVLAITLVALVSGLIEMGIARIRAASHRSQCQNQLRSLGLAVKNHHDAMDHLPAGTSGDLKRPPDERKSFYVTLLPFIEKGIYRTILDAPGWREATDEIGSELPWRMFHCPEWLNTEPGQVPNVTPYIGPAGLGTDAAKFDVVNKRAGVWGYDRTTKFSDITDGLDNTLLFVESTRDNDFWYRGGSATVRGVDLADEPYFGADRQFAGTHRRRILWANRPIGMNVAFADGSVRFLALDLDSSVFEAHVTIHGDEVVDGH